MDKEKKLKILMAGDTLATVTGLGKVALRLLKGFYDTGKYEIRYTVVTGNSSDISNYVLYGEEYKELFTEMGQVYNTQIHDQTNYILFDQVVMTEKPDIVLSLLDPWNLDQIAWSEYRSNFYWVNYALFEVDHYPEYVMAQSFIKNDSPRKSLREILSLADMNIPVTQMGKDILDKWGVPTTESISLGIDFDKRCTKPLLKEQIFKGVVKNSDFVFMTMGRNSERKKLDQVIEAFAHFLKTHVDEEDKMTYKLYLHTDFNETLGGTDLITQMLELGLTQNVVAPECFITGKNLSDEELYERYKVSDCFIGLPSGGGWEYGYLEAMMHGKPIIYSEYGGHLEYCRKAVGFPVPIRSYFAARNTYMKWGLADIKEAAKAMRNCVSAIKNKSLKPETNIELSSAFDWKHIIPKFITAVEFNYTPREKISYGLRRIV
jgi:glycosyltransferase involved in cell wall biosynthesis